MKKSILFAVAVVFLLVTNSQATLITEVDNYGNKAVIDNNTNLMWYPDPYFFVGSSPHSGNYNMVMDNIHSLNVNTYFGNDAWRLATVAEYEAMYWSYRAVPEQIADNFTPAFSEFHSMREIPYEEKHFVGILADPVMAVKTDVMLFVDVWGPGHYLADMWYRTYYGEDQYLNKVDRDGFLEDKYGNIMGYMFGDKYKRTDGNFLHYSDPAYFNYGAWVISDGKPNIQRSTSVPEPVTWIMICLGFGGIIFLRRYYA